MIALTTPRWNKERALLALLLFIGLLGGLFAFTTSYFSNTNVRIGVCLFPFALFISGARRNNYIYVCLLVLFAVLTMAYDLRIFYFFTLAFYFLWLVELFVGRLNTLVVFLIVFMSPFFIQVITILGFPLRLTLSHFAGILLNLAGTNVQVEGNMMILDGSSFSVDEACMGLNMLAISLLMGVFVQVYRYRVSGKILGLYPSGFFFSVVLLLNLIANVMRILVLVYFRIPPEDVMHQFVGIVCLITYVVIPLHFLSGWLIQRYGRSKIEETTPAVIKRNQWTFILVLPLFVLFAGVSIDPIRKATSTHHASVTINGLRPENLNDGITKISTDELLIYVKTIPEFFTGEHTPLMCWQGSGYKFSGVSTTEIAGVTLYKGTLIKNGNTLHTAWWYTNGEIKTISQLDWRLRMLKGEDNFCLVNVTATNDQTLIESLQTMFTTNPLIIKN